MRNPVKEWVQHHSAGQVCAAFGVFCLIALIAIAWSYVRFKDSPLFISAMAVISIACAISTWRTSRKRQK